MDKLFEYEKPRLQEFSEWDSFFASGLPGDSGGLPDDECSGDFD